MIVALQSSEYFSKHVSRDLKELNRRNFRGRSNERKSWPTYIFAHRISLSAHVASLYPPYICEKWNHRRNRGQNDARILRRACESRRPLKNTRLGFITPERNWAKAVSYCSRDLSRMQSLSRLTSSVPIPFFFAQKNL